MTNDERIRNMSVEELAVTIMCPNEIGGEVKCSRGERNCRQCTLNWLNNEADNTESKGLDEYTLDSVSQFLNNAGFTEASKAIDCQFDL